MAVGVSHHPGAGGAACPGDAGGLGGSTAGRPLSPGREVAEGGSARQGAFREYLVFDGLVGKEKPSLVGGGQKGTRSAGEAAPGTLGGI